MKRSKIAYRKRLLIVDDPRGVGALEGTTTSLTARLLESQSLSCVVLLIFSIIRNLTIILSSIVVQHLGSSDAISRTTCTLTCRNSHVLLLMEQRFSVILLTRMKDQLGNVGT